MEKKIYIVTSGEYSDYRIDAVFTTKEKAVNYLEQHGTCYNIEEYNIDEEVKKKTQLWYIMFCIEDGNLLEANPTSFNRDKMVDTCSIFYPFDIVRKPYIFFYVDADSMDRAIKIARERFTAVKANDYIWLRLTRPYATNRYGVGKYERFNVKTNEFIKE